MACSTHAVDEEAALKELQPGRCYGVCSARSCSSSCSCETNSAPHTGQRNPRRAGMVPG